MTAKSALFRAAGLWAVTAMLAACAGAEAPKTAGAAPDKPAATPLNRDPYPSTYKPYPGQPTLVRGVRVYDGKGGEFAGTDVLFADGKIVGIGKGLQAPANAVVIDGTGKWFTPGVIDVHSHMGDYAAPSVNAHSDGNEVTGPVRSEVHAEHGVWPQDPQFRRALAYGVTTAHILPGSANLFGGRGVTLKNVPARTMQQMKFPGAPYSLKMACGENPKRVYGSRNQPPGSRMGNLAVNRQTWAKAVEYKRKWDAHDAKVKSGKAGDNDAPVRDLQLETLKEVLEGNILVQNHCYRADEMAVVLDMAKEFGYKVTAFHHAVESYKIADLLAKADVCSAMWADWWGFKMEAYDGIRENIPFVHKAGACAIVHSDDPSGVQRLNQEAAKALSDGNRVGLNISKGAAWSWLGQNPAKALGIADRVGTLEAGKQADVVLWNADPLSVYARPEKVWVDGALLFDVNDPSRQPVSDFDLGQPGAGDVK